MDKAKCGYSLASERDLITTHYNPQNFVAHWEKSYTLETSSSANTQTDLLPLVVKAVMKKFGSVA